MIYFNNAATTLQKPETVKEGRTAAPAEAKALAAKLFAVKHLENIYLTHSGSQAVELALRIFVRPGDHVIATPMETDGTCAVLDALTEQGTKVSFAGINAYGALDLDGMEALIGPETRVIVCAHGCGVTGNVTDLERVCAMARRHHLLVISDGCQTAGAAEVNLEELGVDVYCFSGHRKLMGPHGIGGLCLKDSLRETLDEEAAKRLAENEASVEADKVGGLCAALEFVLEKGIYGISIYPYRLAKRFFESAKSMDDVNVYGDFGNSRRVPTVSISVKGFSPQELKRRLSRDYGMVVEAGLCGGTKMHQAMGTDEEGLVRFSFGYFNTRAEVFQAVLALMELTGNIDYYLL